jgi:carboxypeptidase T
LRRSLALLLAVAGLALAGDAEASSLVRVGIDDPARLRALGLDVTESGDVVLGSSAERRVLERAGYSYRTVVRDLEAQSRRARARDARVATASALPSGRTTYRTYTDYLNELGALADGHPGLVRRVTLPKKTVLGQPIDGVEIAKDVNRDDDGRPVYVVMGLHHAREWPSAEVAMEFALDLVGGYGRDARITSLLDRERVIVIPVINVDGFQISRADVQADPQFSQTANAGAMKRKNCEADTAQETTQPCRNRAGVDLNRNYGAYWGGNDASTTYSQDDYRGPGPWSEPETQAVHEFSQGLQITNLQTLHNVASLVLRPPGFRALGLAPDEARLKLLGDAMGRATGYASEYGYELYEVTGATEDWNYVAQGTFGYTIELGGNGFQGPYQQNVVDQYTGSVGTGTAGMGAREALLLAGEEGADPADHAIIRGSAPAGRVLRLHKDFKTTTSPVCPADDGTVDSVTGQVSTGARTPYASSCPVGLQPRLLDDHLDTTLRVPADGHYVWNVNPSTRPFERKEGRSEAWTLTCETPDGAVPDRVPVTVWRGQTAALDLACGGPGQTSGPIVSATPPDAASASFEARLKQLTVRAPRGSRLVVGRVLRTREGTLRRHRSVRIGLRVRGTTLRDVIATLRGPDRQVIARGRLARLRGRGAIRLRLPRGLFAGAYRVSVRGVAPNGGLLGAAARVVVRP